MKSAAQGDVTIISCQKCYRVFKDTKSLALHTKTCLMLEPKESFLKYQKKTPYDTNNKVLPLSQPLSVSFIDEDLELNELVKTPICGSPPTKSSSKLREKETKEVLPNPEDELLLVTDHQPNIQDERSRVLVNDSTATCLACNKTFKNSRGLSQHARSCKNKSKENVLKSSNETPNVWSTLPTIVKHATTIDTTNALSPPLEAGAANSAVNNCIESNFWLKTADEILNEVSPIYNTIVHWRKNLFKLPSGNSGKAFIAEMTKQIDLFTTNSPLKNISLTSLMIMPQLLLQKPSKNSKAKDHSIALKRRLDLWNNGKLQELLNETASIQNRLPKTRERTKDEIHQLFSKYMMEGKVNAAIRLLSDSGSKGVLQPTDAVLEELKLKHPASVEPEGAAFLEGPMEEIHSVVYNSIDGESIRKAALKTKGGAGPSGLNSYGWRRILVSRVYGTINQELRNALARLARQMCTQSIEQDTFTSPLNPLLACRLIPLDKSPGIRPIGIGEVLRRIIGKSVMHVMKDDVSISTGCLQLCASQPSGCEAAVHAVREIFQEEDCDAVILVDASNAFNSINRKAMLHNIGILCPVMKTFAENCYSTSARLFITGGAF